MEYFFESFLTNSKKCSVGAVYESLFLFLLLMYVYCDTAQKIEKCVGLEMKNAAYRFWSRIFYENNNVIFSIRHSV